jgi:hypothetical protein
MRTTISYLMLSFGILSNACAATFQDAQINACGKNLEVPSTLQPAAMLDATAADIGKGHFVRVYEYIAQTFETSLSDTERETKDIAPLISNIRKAQALEPKYFDVQHDAEFGSEVFFLNNETEKFSYSCETLPSNFPKMAAASLMTQWVRNQQYLGLYEERALNVVKQSNAHEALLFNGLPMWPWELWLNGKQLGPKDSDRLFETQWILMRPTAGVEINTRNRASANLDVSVGIEPFGFVHYSDQKYKEWTGASLLVTSTTGAGIGIGGLLRWNNYVVGITRHESNTVGAPASNFLFVGIELYDYANKQRGDFSEWKVEQQRKLSSILKP